MAEKEGAAWPEAAASGEEDDDFPADPMMKSAPPSSSAAGRVDVLGSTMSIPSTANAEPERYALSSTVSRNRCILITCTILLSHGLFLWGQFDILWAQYVTYTVTAGVSVDPNLNVTNSFITDRVNNVTIDYNTDRGNENDPYLVGAWSYGGMLGELWKYSKVTFVLLLLFSAVWPHLKLVLLHIYFYCPVPRKPRRAALYWLDSVGKLSLADVCATCMIFLLLNLQASLQLSDISNEVSGLMKNVGNFIVDRIEPNATLSNVTQNALDQITVLAYDEVVNLSQSIFTNEESPIYTSLLEEGCAKFRNGGESCSGTAFYQPTTVRTEAQVITKCLPIRNKCRQCECLVNEVIYNQLIPGQLVESKISDAVSWTFAKLLAFVKSGNVDFASWFSVEGKFEMKSQVFAYPAFIGFTVAVFVSIIASIMVDNDEMKDSMKKLNGGATNLHEGLANSGIDEDKRSLLFGFNEEGSVRKWTSRLPIFLAALLLVPIVFLAIYVEMFNWTTEGLFEQIFLLQISAENVYYSIIDCVRKVNDGTGYGYVFCVLYGALMLGTPLLRATMLLIITIIPMPPLWHIRVAKISHYAGSFVAWEPFFICVLIMSFELPSLTSETVNPESCQNIQDRLGISGVVARFGLDSNSCFVMYFYIMGEFALYIMAWVCLTTYNAITWKIVMKKYDPFGICKEEGDMKTLGGPYCGCRQCCYFGECCRRGHNEGEEEETPTFWQRMSALLKCRRNRYESANTDRIGAANEPENE